MLGGVSNPVDLAWGMDFPDEVTDSPTVKKRRADDENRGTTGRRENYPSAEHVDDANHRKSPLKKKQTSSARLKGILLFVGVGLLAIAGVAGAIVYKVQVDKKNLKTEELARGVNEPVKEGVMKSAAGTTVPPLAVAPFDAAVAKNHQNWPPASDLLSQVEPRRDPLRGEWVRKEDCLVSPSLTLRIGSLSCIHIPVTLPEEYDLTLVAERQSGTDALILWIQVGGRRTTVAFDGWGGRFSGLDTVGGKRLNTNPTRREGGIFPTGQSVQVDLAVRQGWVTVRAGGKELTEWHGQSEELADPHGLPGELYPALGSWESSFKVSTLAVRAAAQPRSSVHSSETSADREIATRVVRRGGRVECILEKGGTVPCNRISDLPTRPFQVGTLTLDRLHFTWDPLLASLPPTGGIQVLRADHADVGDGSASWIARLNGLRELSVTGSRFTDEAIEAFARLPKLAVLRVGEGQFGRPAIEKFRVARPGCRLETVPADRVAAEAVLSLNHIQSFKYPHEAPVEIRLPNGNSQPIRLSNPLPEGAFRVTRLGLPQMTYIPGWRLKVVRDLPELVYFFAWANSLGDADVQQLENLPKLQRIQLGYNPISEEGFRHFSRMGSLGELGLHRTNCDDASLLALSTVKGLHKLYVEKTRVTDAGVAHLKDLTQLEVLALLGLPVSDVCIPTLVGLKSLKELYVADTKITQAGVARLRAGLPGCKVISE